MTIHQPSTKVYNDFEQAMLLSRGQQAFMDKAETERQYFESIGYPMMQERNQADFLVDLPSADCASEDSVVSILDEWKQHIAKNKTTKEKTPVHSSDDDFHQLMK